MTTISSDIKDLYSLVASAESCEKLIENFSKMEPAAVERGYGSTASITKLLSTDGSQRVAAWIFALSAYDLSFRHIAQKSEVEWKDLVLKSVHLNISENRKSFIIDALFKLHIEKWKKQEKRSKIREAVYGEIVHLVLNSLVTSDTRLELEDRILKGHLRIIGWLRESKGRLAWLNDRPAYVEKTIQAVKKHFSAQLGFHVSSEKIVLKLDRVLRAGFAKFSELASARLSVEDIIFQKEGALSLFLQACQNGCAFLVNKWVEKFGVVPFIKNLENRNGLIYVSLLCQSNYLICKLIEKDMITVDLLQKVDDSGSTISQDLVNSDLKISVELCIEKIGIEPFVSTEIARIALIEKAIVWESSYLLKQLANTKNLTFAEIAKDYDIGESLFEKAIKRELIDVIECWVAEFGIDLFLKHEVMQQDLIAISVEMSSTILLDLLFKQKKN